MKIWRRRTLPLLGVICAAPFAPAQTSVTWTSQQRPNPISRLEAPMAYDSVNQRMVVFGGYDHNYNRYNEVWEYTGATQSWRNVTPTSGPRPVQRSGSAIAHDPGRGRMLVFGGLNDAQQWLGDTWEWDCSARAWSQVATGGTPGTNKPEPRQGVALTFDAANDRYLLFGGVDQNQFYRDTWVFNPSAHTWSKLTTSTSSGFARPLRGRSFHGLTHTSGNRVFVFAGEGFNCDFPTCPGGSQVMTFEDLWELVGTTWTDRTPSDDPVSNAGACAVSTACPGAAGWRGFTADAAGNRLVTQGGFWINGGTFGNLKETWAFSLASNTWAKIADTLGGVDNLSTRDSHAMAYDSARSVVVLYGGYLSDLWELSGTSWTSPPNWDPRISTLTSAYPRQEGHSMAWDSARSRVLAVSSGTGETWSLNTSSFIWPLENVGGFQGRTGHAAAYSSALDRLFLFGGRCKLGSVYVGGPCGGGGTIFGDLLSFNPATASWSTVSTSGGPPPARWNHTLVYDPAHNEFVMFGGRDGAGNPLGDTWVLSCSGPTSCTWTAGGSGPTARYAHAMAYDAGSQLGVLFGGLAGGMLNDVWLWNGATNSWSSPVVTGTPPSARVSAAMAKAGNLISGLLLFGGRDGSASRNDSWLLTNITPSAVTWQALAAAGGHSPTPRENPEAVFSPTMNRVILFGGIDSDGLVPGEIQLASLTVKGDQDVSGQTDLLLRDTGTQQTVLWVMNGVNNTTAFGTSATPSAAEQIVGVDDFDADGRQDIAIWNSSTGAVAFWLMNVAQRLSVAPLGNAAPQAIAWKVGATADFNHDGRPDLLWRNSSTQKLAIWTLNGTSFVSSIVPSPDQAVDANWEIVGALDYNTDGNTDLLWYNPTSGKIVFWFLDYNAVRITGQFANPPNAGANNWKVLATGDYGTGGGPAGSNDLVWRNADSGRYVVWHMDFAGNRVTGVFTNPMAPPNPTTWTIVGPR